MSFRLTHPDSDLEIEREAGEVPMYLTQGWETKPGARLPDPEPSEDE